MIAVVTLAGSRPARAAESIPDWARNTVSDIRRIGAEKSSVAVGYDRAVIEKLVRPAGLEVGDKRVQVVRGEVVKLWQAVPGLTVAAMEVRTLKKGDDGAEDTGGVVHLAVLSGTAASAPIEVKATTSISLDASTSFESLDLAAYRIAKDTVALGLRTAKEYGCTQGGYGGGTNLHLTLFVVDGKNLRSIGSTLLASSNWSIGPANDDGTRDHSESGSKTPAAISVQRKTSGGYFDLRKTQGRRSCVLRFAEGSYARVGEDPVDDVNAE